ncbi:MAG: hypothetical protein AAF921_04025 [Cyanobacteria bacterium P01_D01_bin.44]
MAKMSWAQSYPVCPPPSAGEYLLLVRADNESERERALSVLPVDNPVVVCNYVDELVVRAGGFTNLEAVNSWALYLNDIEGFETVVAQPDGDVPAQAADSSAETEPVATPENVAAAPTAGAAVTSTEATPATGATPEAEAMPETEVTPENVATAPTATVPAAAAPSAAATAETAYNPQTLGSTYVVLIDYADQPDIASSVQQTLGHSVGLAVYRERPYLLALTTTDSAAAADLLQTLTGENYSAILVDGEQVIRLVSAVTMP